MISPANGSAIHFSRDGRGGADARPGFLRVLPVYLALCLPALALHLAVLYGFYWQETSAQRTIQQQDAAKATELCKAVAYADLHDVVTDLIMLALDRRLPEVLSKSNEIKREGLANRMLILASAKGRYDQVRLLASQGPELVRIDFNNGAPEVLDQARLQDKAGRYYLQDAMALEPDQIYVSPLDLNVEEGQIEVPHKPMLRMATPVVNAQGQKAGIVILNYLADRLFDTLRDASLGRHGQLYLVNQDGFTLMGPRSEELWGFMLPGNRDGSFKFRHAAAWQAMRDQSKGQVTTADGLYTFTNLSMPEAFNDPGSKTHWMIFSPQGKRAKASWILVSFLPIADLDKVSAELGRDLAILGILLAAFIVTALWPVASGVAARRLLRQNLLDSNAQLQAIFKAIPEGVALVGRRIDILMVNDRFCAMFGYSAEEARGLPYMSIFVDQVEFPPEGGRPSAEDGLVLKAMGEEVLCRKKNGEVFWAAVNDVVMVQQGEQTLGFLVVIQDVTDLRQARRRLAESEERLALVLQGGDLGFWDWNVQTGRVVFNQRWASMLGYELEEIEPTVDAWEKLLHPEDRPRVMAVLEEHFQGRREIYEAEQRLRSKSGQWVWVMDRGKVAEWDSEGRPLRMLGTHQDITRTKLAEAHRQRLEKEYEDLYQNVPCGLHSLDANGVVVKINDTELRWLGYSRSEVEGKKHFTNFITEASQATFAENYPKFKKTGRVEALEFELVRKDGSTFWVQLSGSALYDENGNMERSRSAMLDISQRRELLGELAEAMSEAEKANQAKSRFLASMSHEIRTPMNAIIGLSTLALKTSPNFKLTDYLNKILASAQNLLGIINDILDFSKIEADKLTLESIPFDLEEVLSRVITLLAVSSQEKHLELLFNPDPQTPRGLIGDPLRLGQVLTNLGSNAIKFTEQGEVEIRVKTLEQVAERVTLQFTVRDTGIGMSPDEMESIFNAFSQADHSTTRRFGGTGLGLAISRRLIEQMGGRVWVESTPQEGSAFHFTIGFDLSDAKPLLPEVDRQDLRGLRVMVVDDNATAREVLASQLKSMSFKVTMAKSGRACLEALKKAGAERPFDLVVLDWKMPRMGGSETARRIKLDPEIGRQPKIIMVTAYSRGEVQAEAEQADLDGFLLKPVTPSLLFDTIAQAFETSVDRAGENQRGSISPKGQEPRYAGNRVLVVDDLDVNLMVAQEALEGMGLRVSTAENGRRALEMLREQSFEAVFMDVQMPVMDGYTATREIRKDPRLKNLPVIAMTAGAMDSDREEARSAGMNDHVSKPIDFQHLAEVVARYINPDKAQGRPLQPAPPPDSGPLDLPEAPGLDVKAGLSRVLGNSQLYRRLLVKFGQSQSGVLEDIARLMSEEKLLDAERKVHALKGAAGNIGAMEVFEKAKSLDHKLKNGDRQGASQDLEGLRVSLEPLLSALSALEPGSTQEVGIRQGGGTKELGTWFARLTALVENNDTEALDLLPQLGFHFQGGQEPELMRELKTKLTNFDFEAARQLLNQLGSRLGLQ